MYVYHDNNLWKESMNLKMIKGVCVGGLPLHFHPSRHACISFLMFKFMASFPIIFASYIYVNIPKCIVIYYETVSSNNVRNCTQKVSLTYLSNSLSWNKICFHGTKSKHISKTWTSLINLSSAVQVSVSLCSY